LYCKVDEKNWYVCITRSTFFIYSVPELTRPWQHSAMLWLTTNAIGTMLLGVYLAVISEWFQLAPLIGFFVAGISLPAIPLAVAAFNRVLPLPDKTVRLLWAFLVTTSLFLLNLCIAYAINSEFHLPATSIILIATPFYPAAILAVCLEYKPWLFRNSA
jgi:hypothetical protein